jgi:signal peptidase
MQADLALPKVEWVKTMIEKRGGLELPSHGKSMYPYIVQGSVCRFVSVDPDRLRKGDIVLFLTPAGQLVGHRYHEQVRVGGKHYFICKGDSNRTWDTPVSRDQIVGKLERVHKHGRWRRTESWTARGWAALMTRYPGLSIWIARYLRYRDRSTAVNT